MEAHKQSSSALKGSLFMLLSTISVGFVGIFVKETTTMLGVNLAIMLRFILPFIVIFTILKLLRFKLEWSRNPKNHLLRALFTTAAQYCFFYYLSQESLVNAALLMNTAPLFITLIVIFFQGRQVTLTTVLRIIIGMLGVMLVLNPSGGILAPLSMVGLLAGFFAACSQVITHKMSQKENDVMISLQLYLYGSLYSIILFILTGHHLNLDPTPWLSAKTYIIWLLFIFFSFASQMLRCKAYASVTHAAILAPILFFSVIVSSVLDMLVYHTSLSIMTVAGASLIFLSSILAIMDEKIIISPQQQRQT